MQNWQEILDSHANKATWLSDVKEQENVWMALDNFAIIIVEGPDAEKFLQGQCTCNLELSNDMRILLGAHCNPQGRMLSSFNIVKLDKQKFALRLPRSVAENAVADLKKYIVFSKATAFIDDNYLIAGVYGSASSLLAREFGFSELETGTFQFVSEGVALGLNQNQYELWLDRSTIKTKLEHLHSSTLVPDHQWDLLNIRRGVAEVREQTRAALLPQEMNFQLIEGVSFSKGCYTGQEVIARIHYKGKLKKHMYRASVTTSELVMPGIDLTIEDKVVGTTILAAPVSSNDCELIALCRDDAANAENVHLDTSSSDILKWLTLPYAIPV